MKWLLVLALLATPLRAVTLLWDANPETNVVGYHVFVGNGSRSYSLTFTNIGLSNTLCVISNALLFPGTNYFAVTAFDDLGLESDFSDEVFWIKRPSAPTRLRIQAAIVIEQSDDLANWRPVATNLIASGDTAFFRAAMDGVPPDKPKWLRPTAGKFGKL